MGYVVDSFYISMMDVLCAAAAFGAVVVICGPWLSRFMNYLWPMPVLIYRRVTVSEPGIVAGDITEGDLVVGKVHYH